MQVHGNDFTPGMHSYKTHYFTYNPSTFQFIEFENDNQITPLLGYTDTFSSDDYIIPDSNTRYLTDSDIANLTAQELNYARNEIFARHGRIFRSEELMSYFNSKTWYSGTMDPDTFSAQIDTIFNDIEKSNVKLLQAREQAVAPPSGYVLDRGDANNTIISGKKQSKVITETDSSDLDYYGLFDKNQGIISTGYSDFQSVLCNDTYLPTHNGKPIVNQDNPATWFFDFDHDSEDEMLVWVIDEYNCYHWKLFDIREGIVFLISQDCGDKPGNSAHGLEVLQDGTIHDYSRKGVAAYFANWDSYIYFQDEDVHYLYGYSSYSPTGENYTGDVVLTDEVFALDGEVISHSQFDEMVLAFESTPTLTSAPTPTLTSAPTPTPTSAPTPTLGLSVSNTIDLSEFLGSSFSTLVMYVDGLYEQKNTHNEVKWGNDYMSVTGISEQQIVRIRLNENASRYSLYGVFPGQYIEEAYITLENNGFHFLYTSNEWIVYQNGDVYIVFNVSLEKVGQLYLAQSGYVPV